MSVSLFNSIHHSPAREADEQQLPPRLKPTLISLFVRDVSQISIVLSSTVTKVITKQITGEGGKSCYQTIFTLCQWFMFAASIYATQGEREGVQKI